MIIVKKYGVLKRYEITCKNCCSVLEFSDNDEKSKNGQYKEIMYYIDCPVCDEQIYTRGILFSGSYDNRFVVDNSLITEQPYTIAETLEIETRCFEHPESKDRFIGVGSITCSKCKRFIDQDRNRQIVKCANKLK